jgi:hypothetical protein
MSFARAANNLIKIQIIKPVKMRTLQIEEKTARKLYKDASPEFKATLEDSFGKEFFNGKITDRIKTYADACAELGESPMDDDELKEMGFTDDEINYRKIKTITKALNEDKVIDWNNPNQKKWVPWFDLSSSGFVFAMRLTAVRLRLRVTALAFALQAKNWPRTRASILSISGTIS